MHYKNKYLLFIEYFNDGDFLGSHELLEELWRESSGKKKIFYQGLIQAAVALHHQRGKNIQGARFEYLRSKEKLEKFQPRYLGINVRAFLSEMDRWMNSHQKKSNGGFPSINFKSEYAISNSPASRQ